MRVASGGISTRALTFTGHGLVAGGILDQSLTWRSPPNRTAGSLSSARIQVVKGNMKAAVLSGGCLGGSARESKRVRVVSECTNGGVSTRALTFAGRGLVAGGIPNRNAFLNKVAETSSADGCAGRGEG